MSWTPLPIGVENFEELRSKGYYYVDKTLFIKELLDMMGKVNLFTRPRRFGKTLNMSMLRYFFEKSEKDPAELFQGLKIMDAGERYLAHMGKYPVISVSLKSMKQYSYELAFNMLKKAVREEYKRHWEMVKAAGILGEEEIGRYQRIRDLKGTENDYADSLKFLSECLYTCTGQKSILLIDEYDVPLENAYFSGFYDRMVALIRSLFESALKTNDNLEFAVVTGCLRISKESIFTGLNNLNVMTVSDPYFCDSFGFTDDDVKELLDYYGLGAYHDAMRDWYDGYQFGNVSIYCPWDVIKYAQILLRDPEAEPENYWANTSGNGIIRRLLQKADQTTRDEVEQLINGETIVKTVRQELTYRDIEDSIDNIWSVLYSTGYLTSRGRLPGKQMKLALPNREVRELFIDLVKDWFREETRADTSRINRFCAAFPKGDVATIQDMLHDYLWDSISVRDTAVRSNMKENFYHGMLLGLLQSQGSWIVRSNAETGIGYSDISVATPERLGMVIELKYAEDGNLEAACTKALAQIDEKKYDEALRRRGMKKILKYGIAFWEKECQVVLGVTDQ